MSRLSSKTGSKGASAVRRWIRPGELDPRSFISFRKKTMSRLDFYTFSLDAQPPLKKSVLHVGSLTGDLKKSTIFISIDRRNRQIPFSRANRNPFLLLYSFFRADVVVLLILLFQLAEVDDQPEGAGAECAAEAEQAAGGLLHRRGDDGGTALLFL